jgi:hypothetical protein
MAGNPARRGVARWRGKMAGRLAAGREGCAAMRHPGPGTGQACLARGRAIGAQRGRLDRVRDMVAIGARRAVLMRARRVAVIRPRRVLLT